MKEKMVDILKGIISQLMLTLLMLMCMGAIKVDAQAGLLPNDEVQALKEIASQMGKNDWNFSINPCSSDINWATPKSDARPLYNNTLNCNCSYPDGVCHVTGIFLRGQDLAGVVPPALAKLPYLNAIDLTMNYLNGTIPLEWASMKLEYMVISVNRLSGRIPDYLGNITTLTALSLESNLFSGTLPPELGKLINLEILILSTNFLEGELPPDLTNLVRLKELRISSNNFTGRIPNFFNSWKQLQKLEIQASGLEGPIPSSISVLNNLTELRISDLQGEGSDFPDLRNMNQMYRMMLRSCNISGKIPVYIANMPLQMLDLSFNKLDGSIPSLEGLTGTEIMLLTSNLLSGPIPDWINSRDPNFRMDLSYNNLSMGETFTCGDNLNLFKSFSRENLEVGGCPNSSPCSKALYSLHINCGGNRTTIGNIVYEGDADFGGSTKLVSMSANWGFSSTGHFWGREKIANYYIANNISTLTMANSELYTTARLSPLSLTYYARCLGNGDYTVRLHFAEIVFRDNRSYLSLGRRIFDVYIQEKLVLKDFDIENEAQGVDKTVIRNFTAVVRDRTLEIRFHWSGKGTTAVPTRGVYGPLISTISVESNFKPPIDGNEKIKLVVGVVVGVSCLIFMALGALWWKGCFGGKLSREQVARQVRKMKMGFTRSGPVVSLIVLIPVSLWRCGGKNRGNQKDKDRGNQEDKLLMYELGAAIDILSDTGKPELRGNKNHELPLFSFSSIQTATSNFANENKLGQGGFGPVYKGTLVNGREIAAKRLSRRSGQGLEEFKNEVILISQLQHKNLVRLLGCCIQGDERILIYEYLPNKSLDAFLFDATKGGLLDWKIRFCIIEGITQGLLYLHKFSRMKIIHRDLKTSNVLLDANMNPKISDFGTARIFGENESQANTNRIVGTYGYMSPEYAIDGLFSEKSDVFSFGVMLLEIVSGKKTSGFYQSDRFLNLLEYAWDLWKHERSLDLIDPALDEKYSTNEVLRCVQVGLLCVQESAADRPTMSDVVSMLGNELMTLPTPKQHAFSNISSANNADLPKNPRPFSINHVTISEFEAR